jgi:hypothetical protein
LADEDQELLSQRLGRKRPAAAPPGGPSSQQREEQDEEDAEPPRQQPVLTTADARDATTGAGRSPPRQETAEPTDSAPGETARVPFLERATWVIDGSDEDEEEER